MEKRDKRTNELWISKNIYRVKRNFLTDKNISCPNVAEETSLKNFILCNWVNIVAIPSTDICECLSIHNNLRNN